MSPQTLLIDTRPRLPADQESRVMDLTNALKAMAHPLRLRILLRLAQSAATVTTLSADLDVVQALVSQHLRILRMNALVSVTRKEGFATYRLAEGRTSELLACLGVWERAGRV